jgi:transcriptional regulator with XRE-family HTH domain
MAKRSILDQDEPPFTDSIVAVNLWRLIKRSGQTVNGWVSAVNRQQRGEQLAQTSINRIIIGDQMPTEKLITRIAEAIGCEPWQLLRPDGADSLDEPLENRPKLSSEARRLAAMFDQATLANPDRRETALLRAYEALSDATTASHAAHSPTDTQSQDR